MSLSFIKTPANRSFTGNAIRFQIGSDSSDPIDCALMVGGNTVFEFSHIPFNGMCEFDISEILRSFNNTPIIERTTIDFIKQILQGYQFYYTLQVTDSNANTISFEGIAHAGGISKRLQRELISKQLNMFSYRLMNAQRQFFFTTRTNGRNIYIRENEIAPLLFIAPGTSLSFVTDAGRVLTITGLVTDALYALQIDALRNIIFNTYNELPSFFSVLLDDHYICDISILPASKSFESMVLLFRNSLGVYESIELAGKSKNTFEAGDDTAYSVYDETIEDYTNNYQRLSMSESHTIQNVYKPTWELQFLRDLVASDDVYLISDSDMKRKVHVTISNMTFPNSPDDPLSFSVKVEEIEDDNHYSPDLDMKSPSAAFGEWIFENGTLNSWGIMYNDKLLEDEN